MLRFVLILPLLIAIARGTSRIDGSFKSPTKIEREALSISTTYVTVRTMPDSEPPLAQPGDLSSYGGSMVDGVSTADIRPSDFSTSCPDNIWQGEDTIGTVTLPPSEQSSILSTASDTRTEPSTFPTSLPLLTISTTATPEPAASTSDKSTVPSPASASTTPSSPELTPNPRSDFTLVDSASDPSAALASASAAIESCALAPGGIRLDGEIARGCRSFFDHINTCFTSTGPWETPYDEARNDAYRACVCMVSDSNPFSEYSALWKNFSGCAACIFDGVDGSLDIEPWATGEVRRLHSFCRSQEPDAFLFNHFLRDWFFKLGDYLSITAEPMSAAFQTTNGMVMLGKHYTGRPPLANIAWGPSALPSWKFEDVSPSMSVYTTRVEFEGDMVTTSASQLVTWVPMKSGEMWDEKEADEVEAEAAGNLLQSGLCLGGGPCAKNEGMRMEGTWLWLVAVGVAMTVGGAAVWL